MGVLHSGRYERWGHWGVVVGDISKKCEYFALHAVTPNKVSYSTTTVQRFLILCHICLSKQDVCNMNRNIDILLHAEGLGSPRTIRIKVHITL